MEKIYTIYLGGEVIGYTKFENADPPMGVVFGKIKSNIENFDYEYIKTYCQDHQIDIDDDPANNFIGTRSIPSLKVTNSKGIEIKGIGNQIEGMDEEGFVLSLQGIAYPFFGEEFPHHVKVYETNKRE